MTDVIAVALLGLAAVAQAAPAAESSLRPEGAWMVAQATLDGEYRAERKILNSTWTLLLRFEAPPVGRADLRQFAQRARGRM